MSVSVELQVRLGDGKVKVFSKPAGHGDPPVDIKILQQSLISLKQDTNSYLTEIVEKQKQDVVNGIIGKRQLDTNGNDDESEDEDDEDDDEKDIEPEEKKQKR